MYYIYKITNNLNGKFYIGYTSNKNPKNRWNVHKAYANKGPYKGHGRGYLYAAMRKDGIKNFSFEVLAWGTDKQLGLEVAEPIFIELFKPEYNLTSGGEGQLGYRHSTETLAKISGKNHYCFGKHLSESTRKKISQAKLGQKNGPHTLETRIKMRDKALMRSKESYKYICSCGYVADIGNAKRWHINKCKGNLK